LELYHSRMSCCEKFEFANMQSFHEGRLAALGG
jgi:hypothetical protein